MASPNHTTAHHTTAQILHAVRSGPADPAWRLFTERYEPLLMAVARRLGLDDDEAQDLSQQTLLEFVRDLRAGQFDRQRGRMRTWVLAIARNRVRDVLRRRGRRGGATIEPEAASEIADPESLDAVLEANWEQELQQRIAMEAFTRLRAAGTMSERTIQAFELTVMREVPVETAAVQCGMSAEQVYVARSRVGARLRQLMQEIEVQWREEDPWAG